MGIFAIYDKIAQVEIDLHGKPTKEYIPKEYMLKILLYYIDLWCPDTIGRGRRWSGLVGAWCQQVAQVVSSPSIQWLPGWNLGSAKNARNSQFQGSSWTTTGWMDSRPPGPLAD